MFNMEVINMHVWRPHMFNIEAINMQVWRPHMFNMQVTLTCKYEDDTSIYLQKI